MVRVRSNRVGRTGFALSAILGLALGTASCGSFLGIEEWEDPSVPPDEASDGGASDGGAGGENPGMGGAGGAGTSSSTAGGAGGIMQQEGSPACQACLVNCAAEIEACEGDANCSQNYRPCMFDPAACCKASGGVWPGPLAQAAYACIAKSCAVECVLNAHCSDCIANGVESDVDCGGDSCDPCETGKKCGWDGDCESAVCSASGTCT